MGTQRLPQLNGARVVRALRRAGWQVQRTRGSHHLMTHPQRPGRLIPVPVHSRPVRPGTLAGILTLANLSIREFTDLL